MSTTVVPTTDPTTDKPPRPRRWIPVSLRMFVAMLLLVGVGSVLWIGLPAYRQHLAIQEIERLHNITYLRPRGPEWLRTFLGAEWGERFEFDEVTYLNLGSSDATDSTLARIRCLTELEYLSLYGTQVTDAGLAHLTGMRRLQQLWLDKTQVSDAGLPHLKGLSALESLGLEATNVSDTGLAHLKELNNLEWFGLDDAGVTDAGLAHLKQMSNLKRLGLRNTRVTDAGIAELQRSLPRLVIER